MSEFGHVHSIGGGFCLDAWGVGPFVLTVEGRTFRFEDSDRFGPSLINKNGEIKANPHPGERSPFWRAHRLWVRQGRRVEDDINCIWDEPKPLILRKIGRKMVVVEHGEEDGKTIILDPLADITGISR